MPSSTKRYFTVVIVGGGIGGLTAAIGLKLSGQNVIVVERRADYLDFGTNVRQGLNNTENSRTCLFAIGLEKAFREVANDGDQITVKRFYDGATVDVMPKKKPVSLVHRSDMLRILYERAVEVGVEIVIGETFESIEDTAESVKVQLRTGRVIEADLLVGADGIHSKVRRSMPSTKDVRGQLTGGCVFLIDVPKAVMEKHPSTAELYRQGRKPITMYVAPERTIISWTMNNRELYHLQLCDGKYGNGRAYGLSEAEDAPLVSEFTDMERLRERWGDHEEAIKHILQETEATTKWRIAEAPVDMPWISDTKRIFLIGDAAHFFEPFAGQGACMAIEDAATLAFLVGRMSDDSSLDLDQVAQAYEEIRRPRMNAVRQIVKANVAFFFSPDEEDQLERLKKVRNQKLYSKNGEEMDTAKWGTEDRYAYLENYDAIREVESYQFPSGVASSL